MNNENKKHEKKAEIRSYEVLPPEIRRQYPGKCIIYSEEEKRVIGVGDDWDEASSQAQSSGVNGLWHYVYCDRPDVLIF
jgi:hypothetical protein